MKKSYPFELLDEDGGMVVEVKINGEISFRFLIDTGATHSSIDKNLLQIEGIKLKESIGRQQLETANGWIWVDEFEIPTIEVLGLSLSNQPIQVIDFIEHAIISDYAGVLGMDILGLKPFCIHYQEGFVTFG